ncbi:ABC transporter substrate-binding protein [Cryobacterium sp. Y29]|uniref:ABC transporter substrate-binding protein n=1 Tax=Cryobacterium sp. Y29 TaxID=2048285 RepID=UPI000CE484AD|nr:ABC transporter substrate-binding protein [Cryobacterium sp. Y29]
MAHSPLFTGARALAGIAAVGLLLTGCAATASGSGSNLAVSGVCVPTEVGPGVTDSVIKVGTTMPLSGSGAATGMATRDGQQAYYDMVNADGGVQGRQIELMVLDDEYDPSTAQSRMRQLVEQEEIFVVSGGEGTPNFLGAVPYLERNKVPAIAPYAPSDELGNMKNPHIFMAAVDYITEFESVTNYILQNDSPSRVALVAVAGNVGENSEAGIKKAIGDKEIDLLYIPETPGTTDFTPIVTQLTQAGAEYVYLVLTNADTGGLLKAMDRVGYTPTTVAWGGMSDESYIEEYGDVSQGMLVALETANLSTEDPTAADFIATYTDLTGKAPTKFNQQGWVQAMITTEALKKAKGLSRPCVIESLESFNGFETGIYPPITWGADRRDGVKSVGVAVIEGTTLRVLQDVK